VLYKPTKYDRAIKYPLLVRVYAGAVPRLHIYSSPQPARGADVEAPATFLSRGYMVFQPDIAISSPYPGQAAIASLAPAIRTLIDSGLIDETRIGLLGHSWGGYETAFAVSHLNIFRCAVMGAGLVDSISAYGSFMGGADSGLTFSLKLETGLNFHGTSPWEDPLIYLSNSPLIFANRITTPLLILHNRHDIQVPIAQSLELTVAARRNGVPTYLYEYSGEGHVLRDYSNRVDWDQRMNSFLDYYLLDAPRPSWMHTSGE
jgi:dipeptidyl aminopeptidase/acylaminoacyl peptidase